MHILRSTSHHTTSASPSYLEPPSMRMRAHPSHALTCRRSVCTCQTLSARPCITSQRTSLPSHAHVSHQHHSRRHPYSSSYGHTPHAVIVPVPSPVRHHHVSGSRVRRRRYPGEAGIRKVPSMLPMGLQRVPRHGPWQDISPGAPQGPGPYVAPPYQMHHPSGTVCFLPPLCRTRTTGK